MSSDMITKWFNLSRDANLVSCINIVNLGNWVLILIEAHFALNDKSYPHY